MSWSGSSNRAKASTEAGFSCVGRRRSAHGSKSTDEPPADSRGRSDGAGERGLGPVLRRDSVSPRARSGKGLTGVATACRCHRSAHPPAQRGHGVDRSTETWDNRPDAAPQRDASARSESALRCGFAERNARSTLGLDLKESWANARRRARSGGHTAADGFARGAAWTQASRESLEGARSRRGRRTSVRRCSRQAVWRSSPVRDSGGFGPRTPRAPGRAALGRYGAPRRGSP